MRTRPAHQRRAQVHLGNGASTTLPSQCLGIVATRSLGREGSKDIIKDIDVDERRTVVLGLRMRNGYNTISEDTLFTTKDYRGP